MKLEEIEKRMQEISEEINGEDADLIALDKEVDRLVGERNKIMNAAESRKTLLNKAQYEGKTIKEFRGEEKMNAITNNDNEYRSAWLKSVRGIELNEAEKRAYTSAAGSGAAVIPAQTANEIISKIKTMAPMLNEVTLLHVNGGVKFAVEGTNSDAAIHAENAAITAAADTLISVTLSGYEIVKLVQISDTVMSMSIDAFEAWIVDMLANAVARKIEDYIINGTGSSQPTGINAANTWGTSNSVTVGASASLTAVNVQTLIGLLPAGYDRNAKFVMNKRTLFTSFMPLMDASKNHIVTVQDGKYYVYGYPVLLSDYVAANEAFLGDYTKVCANLGENIRVNSGYDIDTNSYKYSGVALFDCKPAIGEAIVKLAKASS